MSSFNFGSILSEFGNIIPLLASSFVKNLWLWGIIALFIILFFGYRFYLHNKLKKSGIFEIDKLSGEDFEERLKLLFSNLGYKAERTSRGKVRPDYGVDLVIEKDGVKTAVQAKRRDKELIGENAVREAYSAINYYKCTYSMVVTNSTFSKMAKILAKSDNVSLVDRKELINLLQQEKEHKN